MAATYYTLLTKIGQAKIANAIALGQNVAWTQMEVGDGNGNPTTPNENQTALVRRQYIANINQLTVDPENPNYMVAELIIPTDVGGWSVNEVGLRDADGDLVAVSNFPATYKPQLAEGSGRDLVVRIIVQVSNASVVTLKVDPAIVLASQKWVSDQYVKKVTVAGGTTGQVLAKSSNANEAFVWVDPTAAVNVIVDAKPERQTLAEGQTVVSLAVITTQAIAVYIEGVRLIETIDYTVNSATQFTLARSYPAGSRIHMYQNDPTSMIANASYTERGFAILANADVTIAGTDDTSAVTPRALSYLTATEDRRGLVELSTGPEVITGTDAEKAVTPAGLAGLTATTARRGLVELATNTETNTGTDTVRATTPAGVAAQFPIRGHQIYNTAGVYTWAVPAGVTRVRVTVTGGGGGGGGAHCPAVVGAAAGGGGGGMTTVSLVDLAGASSVTVTVGAGGTGGVSNTTTATAGGVSSFGALASAAGGGPAPNASGVAGGGGGGGSAGTGQLGVYGSAGNFSSVLNGVYAMSGPGGATLYGACPNAVNVTGNATQAQNGPNGTNGAGGAGGAAYNAAAAGGKGGDGLVLIEW